jgi:hypothetical protein
LFNSCDLINKHLIANQKLVVDLVARKPEDEDTDESSIEPESQASD